MATLDLHAISDTLLKSSPEVSLWVRKCDLSIAQSMFDGFHTQLLIQCEFLEIANFLSRNKSFFDNLSKAIPLPIVIEFRDNVIAAYNPKALQSLNEITRGFIMVSTATVNKPQEQQTNGSSIILSQIPEPMQGLIREKVALLELPVYLRPDGDYNLPQNSFDIAWSSIGEVVKGGFLLASLEEKPKAEKQKNIRTYIQASVTNEESVPRMLLMRKKLNPEDVSLGKNGVQKTLAVFLEKVSLKYFNRQQILDSIVKNTDYGRQLLEKIKDAYTKKDALYKVKPDEWTKVEEKIIESCKLLLESTNLSTIETTEVHDTAEST